MRTERRETLDFKPFNDRLRKMMPFFDVANEYQKCIQAFQRGVSIPKRDLQDGKVAGGHVNDDHREFVGMAVHLVDQVVDQFGSVYGRLAANHLAVTHAQEGRGRRLSR